MNDQDRRILFSELIARHQSELYSYIFAIVRNWHDADDLYQSACAILWQKFELFRPGTNFFSWARQTALFEIRKFLTQKQASTSVSKVLFDALAETEMTTQCSGVELATAALRQCRKKLDTADEELLELRYVEELGSREIADRVNRPQKSVCRSLNRIRNLLLECIQRELHRHEHPWEGSL